MDLGTVLDGEEAVSEGLIDSLGSLSDAIDCLYGMIDKNRAEFEKSNRKNSKKAAGKSDTKTKKTVDNKSNTKTQKRTGEESTVKTLKATGQKY